MKYSIIANKYYSDPVAFETIESELKASLIMPEQCSIILSDSFNVAIDLEELIELARQVFEQPARDGAAELHVEQIGSDIYASIYKKPDPLQGRIDELERKLEKAREGWKNSHRVTLIEALY